MIPPALAEVWQLMFKGVFNHLEHDADDSAQPPVTQNQRLQHTALDQCLNTPLHYAANLTGHITGSVRLFHTGS